MSLVFFFSSRRRHTRLQGDWSSDVCSSDLDAHERLRELERREAELTARREEGRRKADYLRHVVEEIERDRESTRLNSSHLLISYAVFCLKKKKNATAPTNPRLTSHPSPTFP